MNKEIPTDFDNLDDFHDVDDLENLDDFENWGDLGIHVVFEKLRYAHIPGYQAEFDPEEAEQAGAFVEDALSEKEAMESDIDVFDVLALEVDQE